MNRYIEKLKEYTGILLKEELRYDELKSAVDESYELYKKASGLVEDDQASREAVFLPTGKAIDPFEAGMCVKEFMRTKRFVAGFYEGILEAKRRFPDTQLHILYAGTGPFGTLMLPMTTLFSPHEIKFTLLEINRHSIECLKNTISSFEAWEYIEEIVEADASQYEAREDQAFHMLITETMQRALKKEPHVSITLNLIDQIEENGVLIPENVIVDAVLFDSRRNMDRMFGDIDAKKDYYKLLGRVLEFNKSTALKEADAFRANRESYNFSFWEFDFQDEIDERFTSIDLMTQIQVFNNHRLNYFECSLNLPEKILPLNGQEERPDSIKMCYNISKMPGFKLL